jgi:hypothetical protein
LICNLFTTLPIAKVGPTKSAGEASSLKGTTIPVENPRLKILFGFM